MSGLWGWLSGPWDETLVLGPGEAVGVAIAHAIVLGIAVWRYRRPPASDTA